MPSPTLFSTHDSFFCPDEGLSLPPGEPLQRALADGRALFGVRWLGYRPRVQRWLRAAADDLLRVARYGGRRAVRQGPELIGLGPLLDVVDGPGYRAVTADPLLSAEVHGWIRQQAADRFAVTLDDGPPTVPVTREELLFALSMDDSFAAEDRRLHLASCPHRPGEYAPFGAVDPELPTCPLCKQPLVFAADAAAEGFGPHAPQLVTGAATGPLPGMLVLEPVLPAGAAWEPLLEEDPWGPVLLLPGELADASTGSLSSLGFATDGRADLPAGTAVAGVVLHGVRWRRSDANVHAATDADGAAVDVVVGRAAVDDLSLDLLDGLEREARWLSRLDNPALPTLQAYGSAVVDGQPRAVARRRASDAVGLPAVLAAAAEADEQQAGAWWSVLPPAAAVEFGRQLAELVCWLGEPTADRPALVHGDLSPEHLGLAPDGRLQLLDLRSIDVDGRPEAGRRDPGGSPDYRDPRACEDLSRGHDAFSVGALLFEALAGEPAAALAPRRRRRSAPRGLPEPAAAELGYVLKEQGFDGAADSLRALLEDLMDGDAPARQDALRALAAFPEADGCARSDGRAALGAAARAADARGVR